jgi:hypothetical protein
MLNYSSTKLLENEKWGEREEGRGKVLGLIELR